MIRRRWLAGLGVAASLVAGSAFAQSSGAEVALAEMLYRQGRQLMVEGKTSEACPKFAESYRLDPATGTILNLATCHEAEHRLATAWLEYTESITLARRDKRDDRIRFAQDRLNAIEPKLSRLTVVVAPDAEAPDLEIQVDGVSVRRAAWGVPAPLDPGRHTVEARAPGRKPWSKDVTIDRDATQVTVAVPALDPEIAPTPPPATPPVETPSRPPEPETPSRPVPSSVVVAGGITLGLAVGAVATSVVYASRRAQYESSHSAADYDVAHRWGLVNLPLTGGAVIGAAVTTFLYLSRPTAGEARPPTRPTVTTRGGGPIVAPWFGVAAGGVVVEGAL